jgi:hypothetical protein
MMQEAAARRPFLFSPQRHREHRGFFSIRSDFSREHQLIAFICIWFRLDGELRCKSHPCDLPFGSALQHKFIPDEFVFQQRKKSNQKNAARPVCPSGPRGIRLCLRAVLTRRPGSTGLNPTSLSAIFFIFWPYQRRIPRQTSRGEGSSRQTRRRQLHW